MNYTLQYHKDYGTVKNIKEKKMTGLLDKDKNIKEKKITKDFCLFSNVFKNNS